jgi:thiosulfate oxidation carrier complex protein SoxZ
MKNCINRRHLLINGISTTATTFGALFCTSIIIPTHAQTKNINTEFTAKNLKDTLRSLNAVSISETTKISITAPDTTENGAVVRVGVTSHIQNTTDIYILVAKNPNPLVATFKIAEGTHPEIRLDIRMNESSTIHAVIKANNQFYTATYQTKVVLSGCATENSNTQIQKNLNSVSEPMRIRATAQNDNTEIRVLIPHQMYTGLVKDTEGKVIPAWHITQITAQHKEKIILLSTWGAAVSKNPYLYFKFTGGLKGEKITISWLDNLGHKRSDITQIG